MTTLTEMTNIIAMTTLTEDTNETKVRLNRMNERLIKTDLHITEQNGMYYLTRTNDGYPCFMGNYERMNQMIEQIELIN